MFFTFLLVLLCIPVTRLSDVIITLVTSMLLYTVVFTVYLVVITVRDARRIASREEEKNEIIFNPVSVTSCCGCEVTDVFCDCEENENGEEETPGTDLVEDTELWHQVWRKRKGVQK